jgi:glycosyltransferase involved in cell wall biosynthesis
MTPSSATAPLLSIIIPAYNEELRLPGSLEKVVGYLGRQSYAVEVLIVENGSSDRTLQLARDWAARYPFIRALSETVRGKGHAVRSGILQARGEYRLLCDADLSMPIEDIARFLPPELSDYDVAIGSRYHPQSELIDFPPHRQVVGRFFNTLARCLVLPGIRDTQCGFKCFRGPTAHALFQHQRVPGFAFDVEVLHLARHWGLKIVEVPIHWRYEANTRVRVLRDSWRMARDLCRIRWGQGLPERPLDQQAPMVGSTVSNDP